MILICDDLTKEELLALEESLRVLPLSEELKSKLKEAIDDAKRDEDFQNI